jgi:hypothetical protein
MLVSVETILVPRVHDLLTLAAAQSGNLDLSRLELLGKQCRWRVGGRRGSRGRGTAKDDMVDVVCGAAQRRLRAVREGGKKTQRKVEQQECLPELQDRRGCLHTGGSPLGEGEWPRAV